MIIRNITLRDPENEALIAIIEPQNAEVEKMTCSCGGNVARIVAYSWRTNNGDTSCDITNPTVFCENCGSSVSLGRGDSAYELIMSQIDL